MVPWESTKSIELDSTTQVLLGMIGIFYLPWAAGSFSDDWYDALIGLSNGNTVLLLLA